MYGAPNMTPAPTATLTIDLAAIAANWRTLSARHPTGPVAGVVKADAYGLGAAQVVPALAAAGCRHFFVAKFAEALQIRALIPPLESGEAMLAVLNGLAPGDEDLFAAHGIAPVLGSLGEIDRWTAAARRCERKLPALLHIDTGMNRLGLDPAELAVLQQDHGRLAGLHLRYLMTHLVSAELPGDPINAAQRDRFARACAGLPPAPRSLANSSGLFLDGFGSDLARPGAALYGVNPTPGQSNPMRPAVLLQAMVLQVREVPPGEGVGYNATWRAPTREDGRPTRIATAAIGYADGWLRSLSGRGHAAFDGAPVPLVGRVSMDLATYDVTDRPRLAAGDWLELIGPHVPVDLVATAAGTNGYEILTSLGPRYHRIHLGAAA
jgi:alanine racemase